jgi:integrase
MVTSAFCQRKTLQLLPEWTESAGIRAGYIFRRVRNQRAGENALHPFSLNRVLKSLAEEAGLPSKTIRNLSGLSMSVGAAQDLIKSGMGVLPIMRAGGWKTVNVVARYVENAELDAIMSRFYA